MRVCVLWMCCVAVNDAPSFVKGSDVSVLWHPILVNRRDKGDLDGCLDILQVFRDSSIKMEVSHWDKTFQAALMVSIKKKKSPGRFISTTYSVDDMASLLRLMIDTDGVHPSVGTIEKCLRHFGDIDDPVKVLQVLGIMKECNMPIDSRTFGEFEHMRRFDVVLDMYLGL